MAKMPEVGQTQTQDLTEREQRKLPLSLMGPVIRRRERIKENRHP